MEKIRLKNGQEYNLSPNGIRTEGNKRKFTVYSDTDPESAFSSSIDRIEYLGADGEVLKTYLDCVKVTAISRDIENGTYMVEVSVDAVERKIDNLQAYTDNAICELTMMLSMMMGGF